MKALFLSRATLLSSPGGDTIQLQKTAAELRKLGLRIDVRLAGEEVDPEQYDLVHVFNVIRPADALSVVRRTTRPVFLSSIYVDYSEYERKNARSRLFTLLPSDVREYAKVIARRLLNGEVVADPRYYWMGQRRSIRELCRRSAMILPNSASEYRRLARDYGLERPFRVVPNAIDAGLFAPTAPPDEAYRDAVLCVARIEGRKNQLQLIRALSGAPYQVHIIGKHSPNHREYYARCRQDAGPNIHFRDHVDHETLPGIYAAARVHALASWFETTGLCSLEAASMGCRIVVTSKGDQPEYFDGIAEFCDPESVASIRAAVDRAWAAAPDPAVPELVRTRYTWARAAEETLAAYESVLSPRTAPGARA